MSNLQNPIFENEKEFLERQEQEYKNALLGDVAVLKDHSTEIGKKVLMAGGALAGVWIVTKLLSGGKKKKKKNKKALRKQLRAANKANANSGYYLNVANPQTNSAQDEVEFGSPLDFSQPNPEADSSYYNTPAKFFDPEVSGNAPIPANYALHNHYHAANTTSATEKPGMAGELMKAMATQVTAFLLVYLSKKAEEFLLKNADIAEKAPETTDADFSYDANAGKSYL